MRLRSSPIRVLAVSVLWPACLAADVPAAPEAGTAPAKSAEDLNGSDLYEAGRQLFEQYTPPEIKAQYDYPSKEQFDAFLEKLQNAFEAGSFEDMAAYQPQARAALLVLRRLPEYSDVADWLMARLEEMEVAGEIAGESSAPGSPAGPPAEAAPAMKDLPEAVPAEPRPIAASIPYYDQWLKRVRLRPVPANASTLMPRLRSAFAAEGVPPELAWIAEVESSLRPSARSPSGARGLFQLKADTAKGLGLSTFLPDERTDPDKSAHAAARNLKSLGQKFGSWPLAFAAYNAGEGRVSRLLERKQALDYAGVAADLPAGTRVYVPEVCAVVEARTGLAPDQIPPPK